MRIVNSQPTKILPLVRRLLGAPATCGDDTVDMRVYNDNAEEVVTTIDDMNATPPEPVFVRRRQIAAAQAVLLKALAMNLNREFSCDVGRPHRGRSLKVLWDMALS